MDFFNGAAHTNSLDDSPIAFVPSAKVAVFRSKRPALQRLVAETALAGKATSPIPEDVLLTRTRSKTARITPRAPDAVEDRKYSLFKTVNAMRGQQGYRLRP